MHFFDYFYGEEFCISFKIVTISAEMFNKYLL